MSPSVSVRSTVTFIVVHSHSLCYRSQPSRFSYLPQPLCYASALLKWHGTSAVCSNTNSYSKLVTLCGDLHTYVGKICAVQVAFIVSRKQNDPRNCAAAWATLVFVTLAFSHGRVSEKKLYWLETMPLQRVLNDSPKCLLLGKTYLFLSSYIVL